MDVRSLANAATVAVNPNELVTLRSSDGYTTGAGAKQVPKYKTDVSGPAQVQALDSDELKQINGLNIQGDIRGIYLRGPLHGVIRPLQLGGDLILRKNGAETWLVTKILETWPDWTKAVIVRQE